jgi:hypothetical protein
MLAATKNKEPGKEVSGAIQDENGVQPTLSVVERAQSVTLITENDA